jgi:hypothetical protein
MTTMRQPLEEHPLLRCLASVEQALDDVAGLDPTYLPIGDKAHALRAVDRELARHPRPYLSRRGLRHPGRLVRGPPRRPALGRRRPHRPR